MEALFAVIYLLIAQNNPTGTKRRLQVRILQIKNFAGWNFAGCQEICRLAGKSNVKGRNLGVRRILLVLKNEVFLLVIAAKHKNNR